MTFPMAPLGVEREEVGGWQAFILLALATASQWNDWQSVIQGGVPGGARDEA